MSDGLRYREEEWQALAVKWDNLSDEDRDHFRAQMTRPQWRRFERRLEDWRQLKASRSGSMVTHRELAIFHSLYGDKVVVPLEKRIIALEAWVQYRELPWWRRARLTVVAWFERLIVWLDEHGIRLVRLEDTEGQPPDTPYRAVQKADDHYEIVPNEETS